VKAGAERDHTQHEEDDTVRQRLRKIVKAFYFELTGKRTSHECNSKHYLKYGEADVHRLLYRLWDVEGWKDFAEFADAGTL
jgi:hypothetical protein